MYILNEFRTNGWKGGATVEKKVEEIPAGQQSEGSPAPPKDETPREPFLGRLKPVVLILLIVLIPAGVIRGFTSYM